MARRTTAVVLGALFGALAGLGIALLFGLLPHLATPMLAVLVWCLYSAELEAAGRALLARTPIPALLERRRPEPRHPRWPGDPGMRGRR